MRPLNNIAATLTAPQKAAVKAFVPSQERGVFPDINPRTAQALYSLGVLEREVRGGTAYFKLTDAGEELQVFLSCTS